MEALLSAKQKWNCCCFFRTMLYSNKTKTSVFCVFWLCWVFIAAWAFLQLQRLGVLSSWGMPTSYCGGFSCGAQALGRSGFTWSRQSCLAGSRALVQQSWRMGRFATRPMGSSQIRVKPKSPALAGGFFTTEPPGEAPLDIPSVQQKILD